MDTHRFADPGPEYRGVTLWMLNDRLEPDEIARQLEGFKRAGWGAVITRTFNGLRTEYLGQEWMQILECIVTQARSLDLKVWFQAGYMPGAIPNLPPDLSHRVLDRKTRDSTIGPGERILFADQEFSYTERRQDHVLDLLNPQAVAVYLDTAYAQTWLPRFGDDFGDTIEAIWVDEPHFRPPLLPWSPELPERFETRWGYDLTRHLPALYAPVGDHQRVRHHYWRIVSEMLIEGYFSPVSDWCRQHKVRFSGHLMGEDTLNNQVAWTASAMPCYEYMQTPGIDHLTMSLSWPTGKPFILTPKQCTSVAHQMDKDCALAEMYAVSSQGITFEDRKQIAEWLMVLGINYRCYHGSFYSLRGRRKRIYPPHLSHQQPWWMENRPIADYFARLSYALRQGTYRPEILILHPGESAFCLYDTLQMTHPHDRTHEPADVQALDTAFVDLCKQVLSIQRTFDLGDEHILARHGRITQEGLAIGAMTYKVILLPTMLTLRSTTLRLLQEFVRAGFKILVTDELPGRLDGTFSDEIRVLETPVEYVTSDRLTLQKALADALPPEIEIDQTDGGNSSAIWVLPRTLPDGRLYYLHNTDRETATTVSVRLGARGLVERWDLDTGKVTPLPQTGSVQAEIELTFAPLASHLLVLRTDREPTRTHLPESLPTRQMPILHSPGLVRHDPNALVLDTCRYRQDSTDWSHPLPVLTVHRQLTEAGYGGPLSLQFAFQVDTIPLHIHLVVEDPDNYQIVVNDRPVCYDGLPYWIDRAFLPIDIAPHVRLGRNTIELSTQFQALPEAQFSLSRLFEKREGTELEAIYLTGDFAVQSKRSPDPAAPRCIRLSPSFSIAQEIQTSSGNLVDDGYPFYAGRISLVDQFEVNTPDPDEQAVLVLPGIDAAALAKVHVNGMTAGTIWHPPYEIDITPLLTAGKTRIEIELFSTLRNLLGPHHRQAGEPDQCWTIDYYHADPVDDEHQRRVFWTDDYSVLYFGIADGAYIEYRSPHPCDGQADKEQR